MTTPSTRSIHAASLLLSVAIWLFSDSAWSQSLTYDTIDRATVRVLGIGDVDLEAVEHEGRVYRVALPIAGHGSGVMLSEDGLLLTAAHVVEDTRAIAVLVPGRPDPLPAYVVYQDSARDFALLRVDGRFPQVATLANPNTPLTVRQSVFAIGYPLDATRTEAQSTPGIISGILPDGNIQLGMSVNPGNSGGPVVDNEGTLHAIVVSRGRIDQGVVGMAFAVPLHVYYAKAVSEMSRPASQDQLTYLRSASSARLAELTALMNLHGLEVVKASLSNKPLPTDDGIRRALDDASSGPNASTDGRLLSAAYFWNQAQVLRSKNDPGQRAAEERAVSLVREAVQAEPALATKSPFVKLLLNIPADSKDATGGVRPAKPRGRKAFYVGGQTGVMSVKINSIPASPAARRELSGTGFELGVGAGMLFGSPKFGGRFEFQARRLVGRYGQTCSIGYLEEPCHAESAVSETLLGPRGGVNFGLFYLGAALQYAMLDSDGEWGDGNGIAFGAELGLVYTAKRYSLGALGTLLTVEVGDTIFTHYGGALRAELLF